MHSILQTAAFRSVAPNWSSFQSRSVSVDAVVYFDTRIRASLKSNREISNRRFSNKNGATAEVQPIENRKPLICRGTYETEDAENGETVAHRTKIGNRNKTKLSLSHETTLSRSGPRYIPSGFPGIRRFAVRSWHRYWLSELSRGTSCRRLQSPAARTPLSSPLSVLRLGGFPWTDSRNESDPGAIKLRTTSRYRAIEISRRAGKTLVSLRIRTHWSWSRDSARGASPYRTKLASPHGGNIAARCTATMARTPSKERNRCVLEARA